MQSSASDGDLTMEVITTGVAPDPSCSGDAPVDWSVDDWDEAVRRTNAPFTSTATWLNEWWKHYGDGRQPCTFVFRRGGEVVGLVPMVIEDLGAGPAGLRVAKLAGTDHSPFPRAAMVAVPADHDMVVERAVRHLFEDEKCHLVSLGPFRATDIEEGLTQAELPARAQVTVEPPGVWMWLDTSGGEADFTRRMSHASRKSLRRRERKLVETDGFVMELVPDEAMDEEFVRFQRLHQAQWEAEGRQGHFADWPDAATFHRNLARSFAADGRLRLYRATFQGEAVAYEYIVRFGDRAASLLAARSLDERWRKAGVGSVLLNFAAASEAADGAVEFDLGRGHYDYKRSNGAMSAESVRVRYVADQPLARARVALWLVLARLSYIGYYRVWFSSTRPLLRLPAKAIARWWIRIQI